MIAFTVREVLFSLIYSLIFGSAFFVVSSLLGVLLRYACRFGELWHNVTSYGKIFEKPTKIRGRIAKWLESVESFVLTIIFFVGFILLSYYALDGSLRLYVFLTSLAAFYSLHCILYSRFQAIIFSVLDAVYFAFVFIIRVATFPFLRLFKKIRSHSITFARKK